jgi:hypothetical protein
LTQNGRREVSHFGREVTERKGQRMIFYLSISEINIMKRGGRFGHIITKEEGTDIIRTNLRRIGHDT